VSLVSTDDLVLRVKPDVDRKIFDIDRYDDFLECLCGTREFQKEAIHESVRFLLGGEYKNSLQLAKENFNNNQNLKEYFGSFHNFEEHLDFKEKLSCTIDLATGTGKTWVMYGVAQILLAEGKVDRVLILCPSVTIEKQLMERFEEFATNNSLKNSLPNDSKLKNPRIIDASQTIKIGDICIENIHATYAKTGSSITDSLEGHGERTLILNDESHHIMNPKDEVGVTEKKQVKKWKEFLIEPKFNFRFIVNFSGTPYLGNNYATDVIYRYNIMDAMTGKKAGNFVIKKINYVQKDTAINEQERFEIILSNHNSNKKEYSELKPLTVLVTQKIAGAEKLARKLKDFLIKKENLSLEQADAKVIIVTSSPKHADNIRILKSVDNKLNKVEWIVSVSMLTEGWDVKNVFQIVPHEERAFNSKLLIAQVLGRGLRIPIEYEHDQPTVIVYNHAKWSSAIEGLVYEVMSYEKRIRSYQIEKEKNYNFSLDQINYNKVIKSKKLSQKTKPISIPIVPNLSSQPKIVTRDTTYHKFKENQDMTISTKIFTNRNTVSQLVNDIKTKLALFDEEESTDYLKKLNPKKLKQDIIDALKEINDKSQSLTDDNYNRILTSYSVLKRQISGTTTIERVSNKPFKIKTEDLNPESISLPQLMKDNAIIFDKSSVDKSRDEDKKLFMEAFNESPRQNTIEVDNTYLFKCPFNTVILSHSNEIDFARKLVDKRYADKIDAWIKSADRGFYDIPYSYRKGNHQKEAKFNPDFFIKIGNDILVVEIKSDEDVSDINKAKMKFAKAHFEELNNKGLKQKYYFKFLSPKDFSTLFDSILNKTYQNYVTDLDAELSN